MSAYMVDKVHVDLMIAVALEGPRDNHAPRGAWLGVRWLADDLDDIEAASATSDEYVRRLNEARRQIGPGSADDVGRFLVAENLRSIRHRYPDTAQRPEATPGPADPYWKNDYAYRDPGYRLSVVEALKAIDCYEYQACEHPEWRRSEARRFCDSLRGSVVGALPGYWQANWSWSALDVAAAERDPDQITPPAIDVPEDAWRDADYDETAPSGHRLVAAIVVNGTPMQLEAYLVDPEADPQRTVVHDETVALIHDAVAAGSRWQTTDIRGRPYLLVATPLG